jgi:4-amino-4-deoxy-L-arabinose transferase-like glycosyltransferase
VKFGRALLCIVIVAFGIRVAYVAVAKGGTCDIKVNGNVVSTYPGQCAVGDQLFYNAEADGIAKGKGFTEPLWNIKHPGQKPPPAADHPPAATIVFSGVAFAVEHPPLSWIAGDSIDANVREMRYAMVLLGTLLVWLIGLLGRRIGGDAVGLVAAGIAALSPNIWVNDGLVMSETVTSVIVVLALYVAVRSLREPTPTRVAILGALCGLAALSRAELILFVPLLAIPIAWHRPNPWRRVLTTVLASVIVITPWIAYNESRFKDPTFISTNDGIALAGSNCQPVYYGRDIGLTDLFPPCLDVPPPPGDQSQVAKVYRSRALHYAHTHAGRAVLVALARVGRTWSLYRPTDMVWYNVNEGRERWVTRLGLFFYFPTLVFAIGGAVLLMRRKRGWYLWILAVPAIVVTLSSAATYGQTRFRAAAEPSLALLAAVGIVALVERIQRDRRARLGQQEEHDDGEAVDAEGGVLHGMEPESH